MKTEWDQTLISKGHQQCSPLRQMMNCEPEWSTYCVCYDLLS